MQELYTPQEVAEMLKVPRKTVYTWLQANKLSGLKVGDLWRIPKTSLEEFLQSGKAAE